MTDQYKWNNGPERVVGLATEGSKVTGQVRILFNRSGTANVQTVDGYKLTTADLMVGAGGPYWLNLQLDRQADGAWKLRNERETSQHFSRKGTIGDSRPVPPTHRAAITEAVERAVADVAQPHVLAEADYADACREAHRIAPQLAEAEAKVRELRKALRGHARVIEAYERPGEQSTA